MTRILLTGAQRFIGGHVLDLLLARGHSVVTTVRSRENELWLKRIYPNLSADKLEIVIAENKSGPAAFNNAVISNPPFETVIHTANSHSYFHDKESRGLIGSSAILKAIQKTAPTVKRVVITSSLRAILDPQKPIGEKYSEADWSPIAKAEAPENATDFGFVERDAWDFVEREKPNFTLTSCIPATPFGPMIDRRGPWATGSSTALIQNFITGAAKKACPPSKAHYFVDVRDLALSHVLAAEKEEAAGKRFFIAAHKFCNKQIVEAIGENFPQLRDRLPTGLALNSGDFPTSGVYDFDNRRSVEVLGMRYRSLEETIVDTVSFWTKTNFREMLSTRRVNLNFGGVRVVG